MITPQLFFAACVVVAVVLVWLIWAVCCYRSAVRSLKKACSVHNRRADAIDADRQSVAAELVKEQDKTTEAIQERDELEAAAHRAGDTIVKVKAERDEARSQAADLKGQILDRDNQIVRLSEERDRLAENEAEVVAANKEMHQRLEAEAARPVLAVATKASQRGRVRIQIREDDTVLLQSPAGYGTQEKADAIVERICGSRLENHQPEKGE